MRLGCACLASPRRRARRADRRAWFDPQLNELGAAYFRSQGFDVVSSASAELSHDPLRIDPVAVYAWTSRHVGDEAEGVFFGGNGLRFARAIERLEAALGRPVLTSNQVLLWNLLAHASVPVEITRYGQLFAASLRVPQRNVETLREVEEHLAARPRAPRLDEAEMPRRHRRAQGELQRPRPLAMTPQVSVVLPDR